MNVTYIRSLYLMDQLRIRNVSPSKPFAHLAPQLPAQPALRAASPS